MKLSLSTGGSVNLTKQHYLASGGEGDVYALGSTAYKVYHDPKRMIPLGKVTELAAITDKNVVKPEAVLTDAKGVHVGYSMRYVTDTVALCATFPAAYRDRTGLKHDRVLKLVERLRAGVASVHSSGILIVDLNEMNFLVAADHSDIFFIDADSYQTRSYPATAIMESVRDPLVHGNDFTEASDWFSFGVVSFQMFTGIHPFKGKHPSVHGMTERMRAGISVFNKDVGVPKAAYPVDVIPPAYRSWYESVFERGVRCAPPGGVKVAVVAFQSKKVVRGSGHVLISEISSFPSDVHGFWDLSNATRVTLCEDGVYLGNRRAMDRPAHVAGVACTASGKAVLVAKLGQRLALTDIESRAEVSYAIAAEQVMVVDGRAYAKLGEQVYEVLVHEAGTRLIASSQPAANCMLSATKLFPGVAYQNMLGAAHLTLFPKSGESYTVRVPELDGYQIVEAAAHRNVAVVVGSRGGKYDRLVLRFSPDYAAYDARVVPDVPLAALNFVTLDTGVCAMITEDERLELFVTRYQAQGVKVVEDPAIGGDMRLVVASGKVAFYRAHSVSHLSTVK